MVRRDGTIFAPEGLQNSAQGFNPGYIQKSDFRPERAADRRRRIGLVRRSRRTPVDRRTLVGFLLATGLKGRQKIVLRGVACFGALHLVRPEDDQRFSAYHVMAFRATDLPSRRPPILNSAVASMVGSGGVADSLLVSFFDLRKSCPAPHLFIVRQALVPQGQQPRFYTYIFWSRGGPRRRFGVRRSVPSPKIVTRYRRPSNHVCPLRRVIFSDGSQSLIVALDRPGSHVRGILGHVCD